MNASDQLEYIKDAVRNMKPGQVCEFARDLLIIPVPPPWKPEEWVLEGIVGSAYEFSIYRRIETGNVAIRIG